MAVRVADKSSLDKQKQEELRFDYLDSIIAGKGLREASLFIKLAYRSSGGVYMGLGECVCVYLLCCVHLHLLMLEN